MSETSVVDEASAVGEALVGDASTVGEASVGSMREASVGALVRLLLADRTLLATPASLFLAFL